MNPKTYLIFLFSFFSCASFSQETPTGPSMSTSPLTPNAASIGKYGEIPVSLCTGIPNIQIPIFDIVVKDFHLPISLNYHASGIKVEDIPSWVGMGWTLNAGGVLSRRQLGIPDEEMIDRAASFSDDISIVTNPNIPCFERVVSLEKLDFNKYDTQRDIFSFSAGNESGEFFMDADYNCYTMPAGKYKIQINPTDRKYVAQKSYFSRWTITNKDGVKFIFGKTSDDLNEEFEISGPTGQTERSINSWYLNEIRLPSGESIYFTYSYYNYSIEGVKNETYYFDKVRSSSVSATEKVTFDKVLRLNEIIFPQGKIRFVPGAARKDLVKDKVLESIEIYRKGNAAYTLEKSYKFITNNPSNVTATEDDLDFRLALKSIEEISRENVKNAVYTFEYENEASSNFGLPARNSLSQDLWGYYNAEENSTLAPNCNLSLGGKPVGRIMFSGAKRRVNIATSKYGVLNKIIYPTGGSTIFDYESNVASFLPPSTTTGFDNLMAILTSMEQPATTQAEVHVQSHNTNGSDITYSDAFTINSEGFNDFTRQVQVSSHIMYGAGNGVCEYSEPGGTGKIWNCLNIEIEKQNSNGDFVPYISSLYFDRSFPFDCNETYRIKVEWENTQTALRDSWAYVDLYWAESAGPDPTLYNASTEKTVGGLRIKKITDSDFLTGETSVRKFNYEYNANDDGRNPMTSGVLQNLPLYIYNTYTVDPSVPTWTLDEDCLHLDDYEPEYTIIYFSVFSNSPLYQTNGGYVGYKKVTVDYGENTEFGREIFYFTNALDYPDGNLELSHISPFPPPISYSWRRGLLLKTIYLKASDLYGLPIKTVTNSYQFNNSTTDENFKSFPNVFLYGSVFGSTYDIFTESFFLKEVKTIESTVAGEITTTTSYEQSKKCLSVSSTTTDNSHSGEITSVKRYSADIYDGLHTGSDTRTQGIRSLINDFHILTAPIETYEYITKPDGVKYITGGSVITYSQNPPLPDKVYSLEITSPKLFTQHTPCSIDVNGNFIMDPDYKLQMIYDKFDSKHNLQELHKKGDVHSSYIWGYNNTMPVIKAENSNFTTLLSASVASLPSGYTSIESLLDAVGEMTLTSQKTLWESFNTSLRDNVSLAKSRITTYTFKFSVGMTSQTDPNGATTYYEYDAFGRLKLIKDNDGNIIKTIEYNYAK